MNKKAALFCLLPVGVATAQQPTPVNPRDLSKFQFAQSAALLQQQTGLSSPVANPALKVLKPISPALRARRAALKAHLVTPVNETPLTFSALEALAISQNAQTGDALPTPGQNGSVKFTYGAALPPVICAPERLTTIFLERGERIKEQPGLGDSTRWLYTLMTSGDGPTAQTLIVIKPKQAGLSTDLVVATDRRTYQLQLTSRSTEHISQVEFSYLDEEEQNWRHYQAEQARREAEQADKKKNTIATLAGDPNYKYTIKIKRHTSPKFVPKAVFDDGVKTFLKMPTESQHWDAAVLQIAGPQGCEIVNYRVGADSATWTVDRLFDSATLVSGTGKHAEQVQIHRDGVVLLYPICGKHSKMMKQELASETKAPTPTPPEDKK